MGLRRIEREAYLLHPSYAVVKDAPSLSPPVTSAPVRCNEKRSAELCVFSQTV